MGWQPLSTSTERTGSVLEGDDPFETSCAWRAGGFAGLSAAVVMGVAISVMDLETLRLAIAGLYGQAGDLTAGWVAHLVHGTLFGTVYTILLTDPGLHHVTDRGWKPVLVGIVYGVLLAIVGAGIIMPIWLGVVGFPTPPTIPYVTWPLLVWHLIYGSVLGGVFWMVEGP